MNKYFNPRVLIFALVGSLAQKGHWWFALILFILAVWNMKCYHKRGGEE